MPITKKISDDGKTINISISERFDFSQHQKFRDTYSDCQLKGSKFIVDLYRTTYLDSSALGMILLLKDHAENVAGEVIITRPTESINKILHIAQFHRLFTIEK